MSSRTMTFAAAFRSFTSCCHRHHHHHPPHHHHHHRLVFSNKLGIIKSLNHLLYSGPSAVFGNIANFSRIASSVTSSSTCCTASTALLKPLNQVFEPCHSYASQKSSISFRCSAAITSAISGSFLQSSPSTALYSTRSTFVSCDVQESLNKSTFVSSELPRSQKLASTIDFSVRQRRGFSVTALPSVERSSADKASRYQESMETDNMIAQGIIIRDPAGLERKKKAIRQGGNEKLQVIADFDMTLTSFMVNGRRGQSCHSLVVTEDEAVNEDRRKLHAKYYPLEIDATIPYDQKLKYMEEWWAESHRLIVKGGLTLQAIRQSVQNANIAFRNGSSELFEILAAHNVPVLIFSAGLADIIEEVLRQKLSREFENVKVVSNRMDFDEQGRLRGFKGRVIHVLNKNEHALEMNNHKKSTSEALKMDCTEAETVLHRTNVVLLGDHLGDLRMSEGVEYENRITVGFLNDNVDELLHDYMEQYDIVLLNNSPMDTVTALVKDLV